MNTAKIDVKPLCIDLDGTLFRGDVFVESLLLAFTVAPLRLVRLIFSAGGRARLKWALTTLVDLPVDDLPLNPLVVDLIERARSAGRPVYLATATAEPIAVKIAARLGLTGVFASTENENMKSAVKAERLVREFGAGGFDYAGDAWADLAVWRAARTAIVVDPGPFLKRAVHRLGRAVEILNGPRPGVRVLLKLLRVHQWSKNILIFVPILCSHRVTDAAALTRGGLAFIAFGMIASAGYIINDLLDIQNDRRHAHKRKRPFAAGTFPVPRGVLTFVALVAIGFLTAFTASANFAFVLALYFASTLAYSFKLKRLVVLDVITLSMLYSIRLIAGNVVAEIPVSDWLLGFSGFLFVSLAFAKRYSELHDLLAANRTGDVAGRGYRNDDLPTVRALGISSGLIATLVMALYIRSPEVLVLYHAPYILWLVVPVLIFWVCRLWILAGRGDLHHDPIVFTLRDRVSWTCGALILAVAAAASIR